MSRRRCRTDFPPGPVERVNGRRELIARRLLLTGLFVMGSRGMIGTGLTELTSQFLWHCLNFSSSQSLRGKQRRGEQLQKRKETSNYYVHPKPFLERCCCPAFFCQLQPQKTKEEEQYGQKDTTIRAQLLSMSGEKEKKQKQLQRSQNYLIEVLNTIELT